MIPGGCKQCMYREIITCINLHKIEIYVSLDKNQDKTVFLDNRYLAKKTVFLDIDKLAKKTVYTSKITLN